MNGRRIVWLTLLALGVTVVLAAMSALANPPNINNPPTEDWVFDSGGRVVISDKTWNINYNITVCNDTNLVLDSCTFTFSDPADRYSRWLWVQWNGSIDINSCSFSSTGNAKYFLYFDNITSISESDIAGMMPPGSSYGGISVFNTELSIRNTTVRDTEGIAIKAENCNVTARGLTVSGSGGDWTDGAAFLAMYVYNSYDDSYVLDFDDCRIIDNPWRGFGIRSYMNWADIMATFDNCIFADSGQRGFDIYWGRDGSIDSTNASLDLTMTKCTFDGTHWDGFRFQQYEVGLDGSSHVSITLDTCDFIDIEGSGAFINVYRGDQAFNIVVKNCDFSDNAIGGRAGLAFENRYLHSWDVTVTGCTFTDNDWVGLDIRHYSTLEDGGKYTISDCTFTGHTYGMYIYNYRYSGYDYFDEFTVTGCTFSGFREAGVYQFVSYCGLPLEVHFDRCDFTDSDGRGLLLEGSNDQTDGFLWDVMDCTFTDLGERAIRFQLSYVMAGATLDIDGCTIDNTAGIEYLIDNSLDTSYAENVLRIADTEITNSTETAVSAMVYGYFGGKLTAELDTVDIKTSMLGGFKIMADKNFVSATGTVDMDLKFIDVLVDTVSTSAIEVGTPSIDYGGTRTISVSSLTISKANQALVLSGVKGQLWDTSITGVLRADVTVINSEVELFQPVLDVLDDETVDVIEAGAVLFWYTLKVYVNWDTGLPVEGAVVEITDNQRTLIGIFTQQDETGLPLLMLNSFQFRTAGQFTRSPYILNVTFRAIQKMLPVPVSEDTEVTIELSDIVPPKVYINEPLSDQIQKDMTINVRGSSFDAESMVETVEISLDGVNWVEPTTTTDWDSWSHTFVVTEQDVIDNGGIFAIRARAFDAAGNDASTITKLEIDPFPPELRVDFPYHGLQTNKHTIDIRGVTESEARVEINGIEVDLVGTLFVFPMELKEGPNTITIAALDELGNSKQVKMEVVLDTKDPYLVLLNPVEGQMFTSPSATVSGQAEDGLVIWVNGNMLDDTQYDNGTFEYTVDLNRGANSITVRAMDMACNELTTKRNVFLDDEPPVLAIQTPMDNSHQNVMTIAIVGTTEPDATILINGVIINLDNNLFSHSYVGVEGPNELSIVATDMAGNIASVTLTVNIDTVGPTLAVTTPADATDLVTLANYTITGEAPGASYAFVNGAMHEIDTSGAFSVPVTLLEGENRFIISVEDLAGNSVTVNRYVTLDSIPPVIVVRIPDAIVKDGVTTFKTKKGEDSTMTMTGYTSDAILVRVSGQTVPLTVDGYFVYDYLLDVNTVNTITVTAEDTAGNEATWQETVEHKHFRDVGDEGFDIGIVILVVGLILLALAIYLGRRRLASIEEEQELRTVEEDEVLAPAAMPEVEEEEEDLEDEVLVDEDEEKVFELTPPEERPRTDTSRRGPVAMDEVTIEIDEKDLEEKDAESDVDADESEQEEGI